MIFARDPGVYDWRTMIKDMEVVTNKQDSSMYKIAGQDVIAIYCLMGEALCMIQHLEGAISCAITLKNDVRHPHVFTKEEANKLLEQRRSFTLGQAVTFTKEKRLCPDIVHNDLKALLKERNWLVHKCMIYNLDDMCTPSSKHKLFHRIKAISSEAKRLQNAIEADLIEFSESVGVDMSNVRAAIKQFIGETFYN